MCLISRFREIKIFCLIIDKCLFNSYITVSYQTLIFMRTISLFILVITVFSINEAVCQWAYNGNNIYNTNNGNVGIGNNVPGTLLYVGKIMTEPAITVRNFGGTGGATYSMVDDASGAIWKFKATSAGGFKIRDHANSLDVVTIEAGSAANSLYIKAGGGVGIGTATPESNYKFTVSQSSPGGGLCSIIEGIGAVAIKGITLATTGYNYAIYGQHESVDGGAGGYFIADNNDGACAGVFGRSDGNVLPNACGTVGLAYYSGIGVGAWSYTGDLIRAYAGVYPGGTLRFYITNAGAVYADGGYNSYKKVLAAGGKQEYRTFNSLQATESWIEDFGSANLNKGSVVVEIDPIYAQAVDLQGGYKVFFTPVSDEIVLLTVTEKSADHFTVIGVTTDGRPASCSFDYRIVAKDLANRSARMEVVNIPDPITVPRTE
jgi:hypothetical protein